MNLVTPEQHSQWTENARRRNRPDPAPRNSGKIGRTTGVEKCNLDARSPLGGEGTLILD
jgi:hypothetical protein